jgi:membrane protease YdiL (CAAX protease family)
VLACGITWALEVPFVLSLVARETPPGYAVAGAALSAWGPTLAAIAVAAPRRELRSVFRPWRASPLLVVAALLTPLSLHLVATLLEVALGGEPAAWLYPPVKPEHFAALVMFSFGEEFGWRGFAYPRLLRRHGPILAALTVGAVWGVFHLLMSFSLETGAFDVFRFGILLVELPLYSILFAWFFERTNGSLAAAIALHMGGHLDNDGHLPATEVRLWILRIAVLAIAAALAARSLKKASVRTATSA